MKFSAINKELLVLFIVVLCMKTATSRHGSFSSNNAESTQSGESPELMRTIYKEFVQDTNGFEDTELSRKY